ncbi:putative nuclease HARBI1 [Prorops nasuta]|uniref:putative nuclease HARBI1 n=1 Tax=Prorops nasuta TaxID=863751 RepID=UPI0034CEBCEA
MATPSSFRCVADRFDVGKGTAWRCLRKVCNALYYHLHTFIKWPSNEETRTTISFIKNKFKFPNVIGAIDGTHIKIDAPKDYPECYINRKGYSSLQLQVICDQNLKFIHCYAGEAGSVHDMRVFKLSGVEKLCTDDNFPDDSHLLGDAAYSINKYIMVPFKNNGHLTESQNNFNKCLSSSGMMVERSIGLLKGRFRSLLDRLPMRRTDLIPKYIVCCCILHNICILRNDLIEIPLIVQSEEFSCESNILTQQKKQEGLDKKNAIMYQLAL